MEPIKIEMSLFFPSHLQNYFPDITIDDSLVYKGLDIFYAIVIGCHTELFLLFWNCWRPKLRANVCKLTTGIVN